MTAAILLLALSVGRAVGAPASTSTALISWEAGMTPSGANHPEGPVGMRATVHGTGFPAGAPVRLGIVAGNTSNDPALCGHTSVTVGQAAANSAGSFYAAFYWPASAGTVGEAYSICGYSDQTGAVLCARDSGPFTVLAASAPILILSTKSATAGQAITVSGRNWLPPQPVTIAIAADGSSTPVVTAHATSSGTSTGTFSTTLALPSTLAAGRYTVAVTAANGALGATAPGALRVSGTSQAPARTPSAQTSPTPTLRPTITPTATAGVTATAGSTGTSTGRATTTSTRASASGSGTDWAVVGLSITVFLLLAIIGVLATLLWRRWRNGQAEIERERAAAAPPQWSPGGGTSAQARPIPQAAAPVPAPASGAPEDEWQHYAPAPFPSEREWRPSAPVPPTASEPWPGYVPFPPPSQDQGAFMRPYEQAGSAPPARQEDGAQPWGQDEGAQPWLQREPGQPAPHGATDMGAAPEEMGEFDPRTWVWGQDLPRGPYAQSSPAAAASYGEPPAAPSPSAEDALALPGPWRLDPTSVPADLTLPALRGGPPRPTGQETPPHAPYEPGPGGAERQQP